MNALRATSYYDAHAQNVDLTEITSSGNNAKILRMLRDDDPELTALLITQDQYYLENYAGGNIFVVQEGDDLGWLGYLIGRNTMLRHLYIYSMPEDREKITALVIGIEQNRSIENLRIYRDLGEAVLSSLSAMLRSKSRSLITASLHNIPLGDDAEAACADALKGNELSKLLWCDTLNSNTHASNTLWVTWYHNLPQDLEQLPAVNEKRDHPNFDVGAVLVDWKQKLLPLVMSWFERDRRVPGAAEEPEEFIEESQLVTCCDLYKFVRSMPDEAIDGYRHSSHKKRKFKLLGVGCTFILMCTFVLLCLLRLRAPTWDVFVATIIQSVSVVIVSYLTGFASGFLDSLYS